VYACPATWKEIFGINNLNDVINTLKLWQTKYKEYSGKRGGQCWNADQELLYEYVINWNNKTNNLFVYDKKNNQFKETRCMMKSLNNKKDSTLVKKFFDQIMDPVYPYIQLCKPYSKYSFVINNLSDMVVEYYKNSEKNE
jgi:hypothetical protein